jgi:GT2 family glycosyltransferase
LNISVIISTYQGASRILHVLEALKNQIITDFEVIVAIDGSTDRTKELLEKQAFSFKDFKVLEQTNKGRAAIRNFGASAAVGELLVFYDDDTHPLEDSLQKHLKMQQKYKSLCGGLAIEDPLQCRTDIQKYKRYLSLKWTSKYNDGLNELNKENLFLTAANFSIPKSLFERLGGFDERLTDAEDFELGIRALEQGHDVYFDNDNVAWHDDFITCESYIKRQRQYMKANEALSHKLPKVFIRKPLHIREMSWIKRLVFSVFSNPVFVKMVDKEFFTFLPRVVRYRIYDLTITSLGKVFPNKALS